MRAIRARGHEVIGVCADGPFLDGPRAEGFRIEAPAAAAQHLARWRIGGRIAHCCGCSATSSPDLVHAHMPISGFLARMAAWRAGVPRIAYTGHGFWFNFPGSWPRRAVGFAMEWLAARVTDTFLTVSEAEAQRCQAAAYPSRRHRCRQWPRPGALPARSGGPPADPRRAGRSGRAGGGARGVAAGLAQGLSGIVRCDAAGSGCGIVGCGRAADLGSRSGHGGAAAGRWPGRAGSAAGLPRGRGGPDGGGGYLRAAQPVRGPAHVGDRGNADRAAGGCHQRARPGGAGGAGGDRPAGAAAAMRPRLPRPCSGWWPTRRCGHAWARRAASARWSVTTKQRWWPVRWTCWDCRSIPRA